MGESPGDQHPAKHLGDDAQTDEGGPALAVGDRKALLLEARRVVEQLKFAELRNYFRDPCLAPTPLPGPSTSDTDSGP